jgi:hypothetical protein
MVFHLAMQFLVFLLEKNLSNKWSATKTICGIFGPYKYEDSFAHVVCGESMVETF